MTTIGIDEISHKELKSLCKAHKKSIVEFMRHTVIYLKKTGIDPEHSPNETPQKAIHELSKKLGYAIGFMKAQELEKINPLLETMMMLVRRAELMLNDAPKETSFKSTLNKMEEMMEADQNYHLEQLKNQHKYYTDQLDLLQKRQDQANAIVSKKMDELRAQLDKMTG